MTKLGKLKSSSSSPSLSLRRPLVVYSSKDHRLSLSTGKVSLQVCVKQNKKGIYPGIGILLTQIDFFASLCKTKNKGNLG